jgi:hypothetical protein
MVALVLKHLRYSFCFCAYSSQGVLETVSNIPFVAPFFMEKFTEYSNIISQNITNLKDTDEDVHKLRVHVLFLLLQFISIARLHHQYRYLHYLFE